MVKLKQILVVMLVSSICIGPSLIAASFIDIKQATNDQKPASYLNKNVPETGFKVQVSGIDLKAAQKEDLIRSSNNLPYRFALPVKKEEFSNKGAWVTQGEMSIWRLSIASKQAKSFSFGLKEVFLPQGAKLFFYTKNYEKVAGPFTHKNNKAHKELWSPVMESNEVTLEINVPTKLLPLLTFNVAKISQGYRGIKSSEVAKSGSCNNDVVCSEADAWRAEIRSVARYTITIDGSSFLCTGTLMNNIRDDLRPLFLTAGHCGVDATTSQSMVIYWNYETSVCGGTPDGQLNQFQTGTTFLAGTDPSGVVGSDFAMVELDSAPNANFNVYWAGWDRTASVTTGAVGIHHPAGDEKRISFDNDPTTTTDYYSSIVNTSGTHLRVGQWEDGTTEGGSSGSGLWNLEHRLVATLSGGDASCQAQDSPDWYGRLFTHWEGNGQANGQVKVWLDPDSTDAGVLDGRNACDAPTVTLGAVPATAVIGEQINVSASATGGTGPYTYSWNFNQDIGVEATGETASYIYEYLYQGNIKVTVTDSLGCPSSDSAAIVVSNSGDELYPVNNTIPSDWSTSTDAEAGWSIDTSIKYEGESSIRSDVIIDNQTASIEVTQNFDNQNNNFIGFAYRVSSEEGYDKLTFFVDDVVKGSWSGEVDWGVAYYELTTGPHTLKWSYIKDGSVTEGSDTAWIDGVTGITFPVANDSPIAAVAETTIEVVENQLVNLDSSSSSDPNGDPLTFLWTQTEGEAVELTNANNAVATFTAPSVTSSSTFVFSVLVTDSVGATDTETVTVTVSDENNNDSPVAAVAIASIVVTENNNVTLDASSSSDPNGDTLTYAWVQTSGSPSVTLNSSNEATTTFMAPGVSVTSQLVFTVTVTDPSGASDTAQVSVTINNVVEPEPEPEPDNDSGGGGSILLSLFTLLLIRRKSRTA